MNRTLLYLILFMASMTLQAQTEYGLLINTDLEPRTEREQTQGSYDIFFLGNSLNLFPNGTYQPISQTDFFYATPDPVTKRIDFSCFSMHQDCYIEKNTFIETNGPQYVTFFSGCFASSSILLLHLTNTSSKTSYCVNETINFENGFNWQYSYDGQNWANFPSDFQSYPSISFKISELENYNGKTTIHFRTGYQTQFTNIVTYGIIGCSPELAEKKPTTTAVECANTATGSATLKFESLLKKDDQFLFNLFRVNPVAPDTGFIKSIKASEEETKNKTYTWNGIAAGTYTIKYQAQSTADNGQQVGLSAIVTDPFTIDEKVPLTFKTTAVQPACSTDLKGILITASGGTPPYYYLLDGEPLAQKHLFTNPHTIPITEDGPHTIKIVDKFDCTEQ
ncbi:hypothetical protein [Flavobacterium tructae]|nr:hypothetical protein [Flavobacterium tructae]